MGGHMFVGRVVSNRMQKTVVVAVDRVVWYPKQKTYVKRTSKHFAHDEEQACDIGDLVKINHAQRMSKHKHYKVTEVLRKMPVYSEAAGAAAIAAAGGSSVDQVGNAQQRVAQAEARLSKLREMYEKELGAADLLSSSGGSSGGSSSSSGGSSSSSSSAVAAGS